MLFLNVIIIMLLMWNPRRMFSQTSVVNRVFDFELHINPKVFFELSVKSQVKNSIWFYGRMRIENNLIVSRLKLDSWYNFITLKLSWMGINYTCLWSILHFIREWFVNSTREIGFWHSDIITALSHHLPSCSLGAPVSLVINYKTQERFRFSLSYH